VRWLKKELKRKKSFMVALFGQNVILPYGTNQLAKFAQNVNRY